MSGRGLLIHALLLLATFASATVSGAVWAGVDPFASGSALVQGLPYSVALLAILLCHEFGHYLLCRRHGVDASLPYFLPAPLLPFGTFGAFIRIRSRFPDRRALFDIGMAGPWAGFVVALVVLVAGLRLSHVETVVPQHGFLVFGDSVLSAQLIRLVVGADSNDVVIHPLALAGWFGLFVTSLNLLPAGQLDGGHALYAVVGRRTPLLSGALVGVLVWLGFRLWPGWFTWAGILALMNVLGHPATGDDDRPLGAGRLVAAVLSLLLFVLTFVPEPIRIVP